MRGHHLLGQPGAVEAPAQPVAVGAADNGWKFIDRIAAAGFLVPACAIAFYYIVDVLLPKAAAAYTLHHQVLEGTAPSPYAYRVLSPWLIQWIWAGVMRHLVDNELRAFVLAEAVFAVAALWLSLAAIYFFLRLYYSPAVALAGQGVVAYSIHTALRDHHYQPWSLPEPALFGVALRLIERDRFLPLALLTAVATFNRETACFLVAIYGLYHAGDWRRRLLPTMALGGVWALSYGALRWWIGYRPHVISLAEVIDLNFRPSRLAHTASAWFLFLGVFWVFFAYGLRWVDLRWRRALLAFVLFVLVCLPATCWWETRVWTSFLGLLALPVCAALKQWEAPGAYEPAGRGAYWRFTRKT